MIRSAGVLLSLLFSLLPAAALLAEEVSSIELLLGPPSLGQGGSNPVAIPPANPIDWQVTYVNPQKRELVFSIIPGFFYGQRWYLENVYAAFDAGILLTTSGIGAGVAQALGYHSGEIWGGARFQVEYRQIVGYARYGLQFPYTLRMGLSHEF